MPRLSTQDWDRAKAMWASGKFTLPELAEEFDVTTAALFRRFKKDGIAKGQDAERVNQAIAQAVENTQISQAEELVQMGFQTKELAVKGAQMIMRRTLYEIKKASQENRVLASIHGDLKALGEASKVLQTNYKVIADALNFDREDDDDDKLPELVVRPMTDEDVARLRAEQREYDDELTAADELGDADALVNEDEIEVEGESPVH